MPTSVLIVDDHAPFRTVAEAMLVAGGYEVLGQAADGRSAVVAARDLRPDVVLLDVQLPDIDGFAVARTLAGDAEGPVIVLTSSREATDYPVRLRESPAHGFILKSELSASAMDAVISTALPGGGT